MQCPNCNGKSGVYGSSIVGAERQRYRVCTDCGHRWKSYEAGAAAVRRTTQSNINPNQMSIFDLLGEDWIDQDD